MDHNQNPRELALWKDAVSQLIAKGYIKRTGEGHSLNFNAEILRILKQQNIRSVKDIDNYISHSFIEKKDAVYGREETWVEDIVNIIKKDMKLCSKEKIVTFSNDSNEFLKYVCMFPETSINLKEKFDQLQTDKGWTYYRIPKDFFRSLLSHQNLIQEGVYKVLPEIIKTSGDSEDDMQEAYRTWSLSGKKEYWQGHLVNKKINTSGDNIVFLSNKKIEKLYFEFPWLYSVNIEDYIEIVSKNRLLYNNYCNTILKYVDEIRKGQYLSLRQEMKEANDSIRIELERAQNNLKRKGIQTVVSIALTFIPMGLSIPEEQKAWLSAVIGATSLKDVFIELSDEVAALRDVGKESPFWLTYQWQKKAKITL